MVVLVCPVVSMFDCHFGGSVCFQAMAEVFISGTPGPHSCGEQTEHQCCKFLISND